VFREYVACLLISFASKAEHIALDRQRRSHTRRTDFASTMALALLANHCSRKLFGNPVGIEREKLRLEVSKAANERVTSGGRNTRFAIDIPHGFVNLRKDTSMPCAIPSKHQTKNPPAKPGGFGELAAQSG
jgi:hypothetical protein